jgi:rhamnosyl/mannosyltransferase
MLIPSADRKTYRLQRRLHIVYPAASATSAAVAGTKALPVVVLLHGANDWNRSGTTIPYYKGFEYLIQAMSALPDAVAIIGGRGPLTESLRELARSVGVVDRIEFPGRIPEAQLPAYYHACDVFCMPSVWRSEGFGIAQLEAMAAAKPVVCCELGNGVNYVNRDGETGLAVPPRDPAALASALHRLHSDPALRLRLGEQGRSRALGEFSLEKMREGTLAVYRQALAQARL